MPWGWLVINAGWCRLSIPQWPHPSSGQLRGVTDAIWKTLLWDWAKVSLCGTLSAFIHLLDFLPFPFHLPHYCLIRLFSRTLPNKSQWVVFAIRYWFSHLTNIYSPSWFLHVPGNNPDTMNTEIRLSLWILCSPESSTITKTRIHKVSTWRQQKPVAKW